MGWRWENWWGADGLLFLKKTPAGINVRFTAVGLGFILFDLSITRGQGPEAVAHSLSERVALFVPKLKLPPDKAVPLSLVYLRSDLASDVSDEMEHQLTLLLEGRLSEVPEYVVLERRNPDALGFERAVLSPTPSELLQGACQISGSYHPVGISAELIVSLRLFWPKTGLQNTIEIKGSRDDLPGLVDAMADRIAHVIGSSSPPAARTSHDEATRYLNEAKWAWNHGTDAETLEALGDAELLGGDGPELYELRVRVLCELVCPTPEFRAGRWMDPQHLPLEQRFEFIQRAEHDIASYHPVVPGKDQSSRLKQIVYDHGFPLLQELEASPLTEQTTSLRNEMRDLANFDPLHGKGLLMNPNDLANSLDEELACYRFGIKNEELLCVLNPGGLAPRFLKTPAEQRALYDNLMAELRLIPRQHLAWLAMTCVNGDAATQDEFYPQWQDELWNERGSVYKNIPLVDEYLYYMPHVNPEVRKRYIHQSLKLFLYGLQQSNRRILLSIMGLWDPTWYSPSDLDAIWTELQNQKVLASRKGDVELQNYLASFEVSFLKACPEKKAVVERANKPALTVDHFWCAKNLGDPNADPDVIVGQAARRGLFVDFGESETGDGVWGLVEMFYAGPNCYTIFSVQLPGMTATAPDPLDGRPGKGAESAQKLYLTCVDNGSEHNPPRPDTFYLKRYDRSTKTWDQKALRGIGNGNIALVNDQLYLGLAGSGIGRYDWDADKLNILASSRRTPPHNQFDDCIPTTTSRSLPGRAARPASWRVAAST